MYSWYQTLIKPSWAPPAWLFGPVWTVLYAIIAISFGKVFYKIFVARDLPKSLAIPFILNLIFNLAFTPLQFGLKNNPLAAFDIVLVLATIIWFMLVIRCYLRWVALVNIPYLLWVSFATMLQITITVRNW